jgi:hypothetical protein
VPRGLALGHRTGTPGGDLREELEPIKPYFRFRGLGGVGCLGMKIPDIAKCDAPWVCDTPCARCSRIDTYLIGLGFTKTVTDLNLYYLFDRSNLLVLVLYVDDLILTGSSKKLIAWCKIEMACIST